VYSFAGATPDAILDPDIPTDHKIILRQSYRLPRAVHQFAEKLIHQVTRRQEKIYLPRAEEGAVHRLSYGTYKSPDYFILKSASEHIERGQSVMFLASCAYMLRPIIAVLRKNGIPFHNPYRSSNGFWNPLRFGRPGSSGGRVLALLAAHPDIAKPWRPWTYGELGRWTESLIDPLFLPGARQHIAAQTATKAVSLVDLMHIFQPTSVDTMMAAFEISHRDLLRWWQARLKPEARDRARFPSEIAILRGVEAIYQNPRIVVGTIHSVKGGEADVVYLFPDFSRSGDECYSRGGADHDAVIRLFYVGATRARQTLYICQSDGAAAIRL
jgi:superfamily I DNA/RNA helicase